jgi:hypothetical protein
MCVLHAVSFDIINIVIVYVMLSYCYKPLVSVAYCIFVCRSLRSFSHRCVNYRSVLCNTPVVIVVVRILFDVVYYVIVVDIVVVFFAVAFVLEDLEERL